MSASRPPVSGSDKSPPGPGRVAGGRGAGRAGVGGGVAGRAGGRALAFGA